MHTALIRFEGAAPLLRLALVVTATVVLNALYCLAYTYSAGHPSTIAEAFSWGAINLAPWVAAIEAGRHLKRRWQIALVVGAAGCVSLMLGFAYSGIAPDVFEVVRRIPGALWTVGVLGGLALHRRRKAASVPQTDGAACQAISCEWVRAAGNYVELHRTSGAPILLRSSLAGLIDNGEARLTRIHRSFAVATEAIAKVERAHVRLRDGTRLPIGNAYRDQLSLTV